MKGFPQVATVLLLLAACPPNALPDVESRPGEPKSYLDRIGGHAIDRARELVVDSSTTSDCTFTGWAVDAVLRKPAGGVLLLIDRALVFPANYGLSRPDVAD